MLCKENLEKGVSIIPLFSSSSIPLKKLKSEEANFVNALQYLLCSLQY